MASRSALATLTAVAALALASSAQADELLLPTAQAALGTCATDVATGDVNDDGKDDVVIGCPGHGTNKSGTAQVFVRSADNLGFEAPVVLAPAVPAQLDFCGRSVAIGDVNGDGKDDVAIGCDDRGASNEGSVIVFRRNGGNTGFDAGQELTAPSAAANENCGGNLAMGKVNGDTLVDIVTGCEDYGTNTGRVILYTSNGGTFTGTSLVSASAANNDYCADQVAIGDVNGDGQVDVLAGCSGSSVNGAVVFFSGTASSTEVSPGAGLGCGTSVAAGDVNGDGKDDIALGCPNSDSPSVTFAGAGVVLVQNGSGYTPTWIYSPTPGNADSCGSEIEIAEVLGDARKDVVMGCHEDNLPGANDAGSIFLYRRLSGNDGFADGEIRTHPTPALSDKCGYRVAVGDVNGDTGGDVVVGCYDRDTGGNSGGSAFVTFGLPPSPITIPDPPADNTPPPPPPPTPDPPATQTPNPDKTPTSVDVGFPTIPAIPVNPDGSYNSPTIACSETACAVLVDPGTKGYATTFGFGAFAAAKAKPFAISARKTYTLKQGQKGSVKLKLNTKAKALLKKQKKLVVTFNIRVTDPSKNVKVFKKTATLKPKKKKK